MPSRGKEEGLFAFSRRGKPRQSRDPRILFPTVRDMPRSYAPEVQRAFGVWAAWPPEDALRIGTLGRLENGLFVPESSLEGRGMEVATQTSPGTSQRFYEPPR